MRRIVLVAVVLTVVAGGVWASVWLAGRVARLPELPEGDQEVAWIHAATSGSAWERFVAGIHRVRHDWPRVRIDDRKAFLDQSTAIPEVVIGIDGTKSRLHIRWYKLTSETDSGYWVRRLAQKKRPPLAFIGGGTSDRAVELARALAAQTKWRGPPPLLLITTATANTIYLDPAAEREPSATGSTPLMDVYRGRSFRFCFTNQQMAQAVVDFVWSQPDLQPIGNPIPALAAVAEPALDPWGAVGLLAAHSAACVPSATALEWDDDPYSIDLSKQFHEAFHQPHLPRLLVKDTRSIPYSVGGYYRPNAWEAQATEFLIDGLRDAELQRQMLVLPASAPQARRILRAVTSVLPLAGRSLVAVTGDSMNVNNVFRDTDVVWSSQSVPIPFVFFTHQNPVAWDSEAERDSAADAFALIPPNGTDDVLLHRDLVRILVESAFHFDAATSASARLLNSSDELAARLRGIRPAFFDVSGDRVGGRGEFVAVLRPQILGANAPIVADASLEIWTRDGTDVAAPWKRIKTLVIENARRRPAL